MNFKGFLKQNVSSVSLRELRGSIFRGFHKGFPMTTKLKLPKTIAFVLPADMGKEIIAAAKKEHRTATAVLKDAFDRYQAKKELLELHESASKYAKKHKITPEVYGGPFAE